jgi:hypothetical protein
MSSIREFGRHHWFALGLVVLLTVGAIFLLWPSSGSGGEAAPSTLPTVPAAGEAFGYSFSTEPAPRSACPGRGVGTG